MVEFDRVLGVGNVERGKTLAAPTADVDCLVAVPVRNAVEVAAFGEFDTRNDFQVFRVTNVDYGESLPVTVRKVAQRPVNNEIVDSRTVAVVYLGNVVNPVEF